MDLNTDQINAIAAVVVIIFTAATGGLVKLSTEQVTTLIVTAMLIIAAITAALQNKQKKDVVAAMDPTTPQASNPTIIATLPERTWKMLDSTKRWLTFDANEANLVKILKQIEDAEAQHLVRYQIQFEGGFYNIEYGLLIGSAGNPSGK